MCADVRLRSSIPLYIVRSPGGFHYIGNKVSYIMIKAGILPRLSLSAYNLNNEALSITISLIRSFAGPNNPLKEVRGVTSSAVNVLLTTSI